MKWSIGLTMRPGRSYLEADCRFMNRQPYIESMLYWANVSVHCGAELSGVVSAVLPRGHGPSQELLHAVSHGPTERGHRRDRGPELVEEFYLGPPVHFCGRSRQRFPGRLRSRLADGHGARGEPSDRVRQEVLPVGQQPGRLRVGQGVDRPRRPVSGADGRRLLRQPAGLQLDLALRDAHVQAVLVSDQENRRREVRESGRRRQPRTPCARQSLPGVQHDRQGRARQGVAELRPEGVLGNHRHRPEHALCQRDPD